MRPLLKFRDRIVVHYFKWGWFVPVGKTGEGIV